MMRMGSFNSAPKINNADTQDDFVDIPAGLSSSDLVHHCMRMRGDNLPPLLTRSFLKPIGNDITDGVRVLQLNSVSKTLGQNNDGFVRCPDEALTWECRKYLIIQEIIQNDPDIVCLQEVDHFKFLQSVLGTQQYEGIFYPKPDSPCLYISENNGPDGCAIFFKKNKFELVNYDTRILEVWRVQSNQVAIAANLKVLETGKEFSVCTTHLKARNGALLSKLRNEQGKDLLRFAQHVAETRPIIMCGDFNAEPCEPVYKTILQHKPLALTSAYADLLAAHGIRLPKPVQSESHDEGEEPVDNHEPPFTTWKIREDGGEVCHTIDYVFYSKDKLKVNNCLMFPQDQEIGLDRTPSFRYPSDHFSLVCDFEFTESYETNETSH
ncbi:Nocturnin [Pseudolycoriella hygida]|uniref:Nocturnin n=1 Tax=Pseudolycoriella hygida TaxID=35572 RepID=A0A9Q0S266_9DIPT|nr:Nocturnin [Pseudolycoriella hygida]